QNYRTENAIGKFRPLELSDQEVKHISSLYASRRDEPVTIFRGDEALEGTLKNLPTAPRVLHLATHAFFRPSRTLTEQPLALSGVALAGANKAFEGRDGPDGEDGILYALEATGLN